MRLLLDEDYSAEIANGLQDAAHDVVTVEEVGLRAIADDDLLRFAAREGRALLTNNVRDFAPLARRFAAAGESHSGIVFTSDASMRRGKGTIGRYIEALSELMRALPAGDALRDRTLWLG